MGKCQERREGGKECEAYEDGDALDSASLAE